MDANANAVSILQSLIRCPSVTPHEGGALDYLQNLLAAAGFRCWRLPFSEAGTPDVDNLFAMIGDGAPHLCFAGHTDVVPPGDEAAWTYPPFGGEIHDGAVWGRGAADMKGGVACFLAAALGFLRKGELKRGAISFLITGDEEGPAVNGTKKVLEWMTANGHRPDHCLLGEPSNAHEIGEAIKIGRRGSFCATLTVHGVQGHVAYPEFFANPLTGLIAALAALKAEPVDAGSEHFAPSNFEVTSIDTGNPAVNVVPARAVAKLNIRFNDLQTRETMTAWMRERIAPALGPGLRYDLEPTNFADNFYTEPGPWVTMLVDAVRQQTGRTPELSTHGGASDGRFIKDFMPVVEFGLCNATIHKVDERAPLEDLRRVTAIYRRFLERYFTQAPGA
ncbi:MAG: succinyl-diaminopimelate desuccinylase [Hyphomicrobiales bacterium]|nr:succinyl-diaminopimelate desuccinylase [Hyphomicrobiales bacterium]